MSQEPYKPSVNIDQAPRMLFPLLHLGTAYGFLMAAAVVLMVYGQDLARGIYSSPVVILMVHFFTLGFLSMTAMGILHQWVPVVFDTAAAPGYRVFTAFILYLLGILVFAWGLAESEFIVLGVGGTLLAVGIVVWTVGVWGQLNRSKKPRDVVFRGIQGALLGFNVVWLLGIFMVFSFLGWWPAHQVLRVHIATALAGWMGILILTVQQKLNPMFAMSKAEGINQGIPVYIVAAGVLATWVSFLTSMVWWRIGVGLWVIALVIMILGSLRIVAQGKTPTLDRVFIGVGAAWCLMLAAAVSAFWLSPLAVIFAFWGMLTLILSYQARIIPFVVAVAVARRLPGPIYKAFFMAGAMHSKNQPVAVGAMGWIGAGLMIVGRITMGANWDRAAGLVVLVLVVAQLTAMGLAMARGRTHRPAVQP